MKRTTQDVMECSGLTYRQLDYLARQDGIDVAKNIGTGNRRIWSDAATAQAVLYGLIVAGDVGSGPRSDRMVFNACRALRLIDWTHPEELAGQYLVIGPNVLGNAVAIVHDPADITTIAKTVTVVPLAMLTARLEASDAQ